MEIRRGTLCIFEDGEQMFPVSVLNILGENLFLVQKDSTSLTTSGDNLFPILQTDELVKPVIKDLYESVRKTTLAMAIKIFNNSFKGGQEND